MYDGSLQRMHCGNFPQWFIYSFIYLWFLGTLSVTQKMLC